MIVKDKVSWTRLLFHFRGSSFMVTWPRILTVTISAMIVTYVELRYDIQAYTLTTTPFLLIGVALGIFLGFRNSASYDKFWEGRKLWGALVNTSRNLARQTCFLIKSPQDNDAVRQFREMFVKRIIAYAHALRCHLRKEDSAEEIKKFNAEENGFRQAARRLQPEELAIRTSCRRAGNRVVKSHQPVGRQGGALWIKTNIRPGVTEKSSAGADTLCGFVTGKFTVMVEMGLVGIEPDDAGSAKYP